MFLTEIPWDKAGWCLLGALLSYLFTVIGPVLWRTRRTRRRRDIFQTWQSAYEDLDECKWQYEEVILSNSWRGVRVANQKSSSGNTYHGRIEFVEGVFLVGNWESTLAAGNSHGASMLVLDPDGKTMVGYWAGQDATGANRIARWVLAREKSDLERAVLALKKMREASAGDRAGQPLVE